MLPRLQAFLNHPAGPKTIHFWAPLAKWLLVLGTISDINRPVENTTLMPVLALMSTGFVWARYSTQIIPINYSLAFVNLLVGFSNLYRAGHILKYRLAPK